MSTSIGFGKIGAIVMAAVALSACAKGTPPRAPERPGLPAYWESDVPREPPRPPPGTHFDRWPLLDGPPEAGRDGAPGERGGTTDRFLWEDDAREPPAGQAPDAQEPMRMLDDEDEEAP